MRILNTDLLEREGNIVLVTRSQQNNKCRRIHCFLFFAARTNFISNLSSTPLKYYSTRYKYLNQSLSPFDQPTPFLRRSPIIWEVVIDHRERPTDKRSSSWNCGINTLTASRQWPILRISPSARWHPTDPDSGVSREALGTIWVRRLLVPELTVAS